MFYRAKKFIHYKLYFFLKYKPVSSAVCSVVYNLPPATYLRKNAALSQFIHHLRSKNDSINFVRMVYSLHRISKGKARFNSRLFHALHDPEEARPLIDFLLSEPLKPYLLKADYQFILAVLYMALGKKNWGHSQKHLKKALDIKFRNSDVAQRMGKSFTPVSAKVALEDLKDLLDQNGIRFFLCSGTLLAAVREKAFFEWDYDIDIGVFANEHTVEEIETALKQSHKFKKLSRGKKFCVQIKHQNGCKVDIFFHHEVNGHYWHGIDRRTLGWMNKKFTLSPIVFYGKKYLAPRPSNRYLQENYGDWNKVPLLYSCLIDTPNVCALDDPIQGSRQLVNFLQHLHYGNRKDLEFFAYVLKESFQYNVEVGKYIVNRDINRPYLHAKHKLPKI